MLAFKPNKRIRNKRRRIILIILLTTTIPTIIRTITITIIILLGMIVMITLPTENHFVYMEPLAIGRTLNIWKNIIILQTKRKAILPKR